MQAIPSYSGVLERSRGLPGDVDFVRQMEVLGWQTGRRKGDEEIVWGGLLLLMLSRRTRMKSAESIPTSTHCKRSASAPRRASRMLAPTFVSRIGSALLTMQSIR